MNEKQQNEITRPLDEIVSRAEFDSLTPYQQGYVSYIQGQWNPDVPNSQVYRRDTEAGKEFERGSFAAMLLIQDIDG